jgi:hypothetical protein
MMVSTVQRRLLVNYRTDPEVTARLLPAPLRPQLVNGWAVSGICLIRLGGLRPRVLPAPLGLRSENAAHRIAVEWVTTDGIATGVYIPRRDSGSLINVVVGGRLFPGAHHRARFDVHETDDDIEVAFASADRTTRVDVRARATRDWPAGSVFADAGEASEFFRRSPAGYSASGDEHRLDGLHLRTQGWRVEPVELIHAWSTFYDDPGRFPRGSALLDCGLVMRELPATWSPLAPMTVGSAA